MEKRKFYCLYCGHWFEARMDSPGQRQCSHCRRRKGIIPEQQYRRGVEIARNILRGKRPKVPFLKAIEDVSDILAKTFPNVLIPGKTLINVVKEAQKEIEEGN